MKAIISTIHMRFFHVWMETDIGMWDRSVPEKKVRFSGPRNVFWSRAWLRRPVLSLQWKRTRVELLWWRFLQVRFQTWWNTREQDFLYAAYGKWRRLLSEQIRSTESTAEIWQKESFQRIAWWLTMFGDTDSYRCIHLS